MKDNVKCISIIGRKAFIRGLFKIITSVVDLGVEMHMFESESKAEKWIFEDYLKR